MTNHPIRLTQYSHGAGCGCKLSPKVLDEILGQVGKDSFEALWVGNDLRDDAAVFGIDDERAVISTTDFFMPIVDDPKAFGKIAAANAISDIYAMGGTPLMAIGILGWPLDKLPPQVAGEVLEGGRAICSEAGIPLAGGHSIDSPEPIFGLAVTGLVEKKHLKRNAGAKEGDLLYLTKALGVGIHTTAEKKSLLKPQHVGLAAAQMMRLNKAGALLGKVQAVHALTDVTGFGLLGHLKEMCQGSNVGAKVFADTIPTLPGTMDYLDAGAIPGGTGRNFESYGHALGDMSERWRSLLCDPQTSGGLLMAVDPEGRGEIETLLREYGLGDFATPIGEVVPSEDSKAMIEVVG